MANLTAKKAAYSELLDNITLKLIDRMIEGMNAGIPNVIFNKWLKLSKEQAVNKLIEDFPSIASEIKKSTFNLKHVKAIGAWLESMTAYLLSPKHEHMIVDMCESVLTKSSVDFEGKQEIAKCLAVIAWQRWG